MKKTLSILALAIIFTACKNKAGEPVNKNMVLVDTTGLYKSNALTDVGGKYVINGNAVVDENSNPMGQSIANAKIIRRKSAVTNYSQVNSNQSANIPQDKGWSHAAKGTVVGAGTGAITGAILNKDHRGTGAIIGALIGAGTGYVIGRTTDKKTGRVDRARARKQANN
jgi:outer membrane lipoprotein SlyB